MAPVARFFVARAPSVCLVQLQVQRADHDTPHAAVRLARLPDHQVALRDCGRGPQLEERRLAVGCSCVGGCCALLVSLRTTARTPSKASLVLAAVAHWGRGGDLDMMRFQRSFVLASRDMCVLASRAILLSFVYDSRATLCVIRVLQELRMDSLLLLTGTPLQNNVQELWSLLRLIQVCARAGCTALKRRQCDGSHSHTRTPASPRTPTSRAHTHTHTRPCCDCTHCSSLVRASLRCAVHPPWAD